MTCDLLQGKEALNYAKTPNEENQCCRFIGTGSSWSWQAVAHCELELEL